MAVGTLHLIDEKVLVEPANIVAVVIGHHGEALVLRQYVMEPLMVTAGKLHRVTLRLIIGRVTIDRGLRIIMGGDDALEILILQRYILQAVRTLPNIPKKSLYIAGAHTIAVAVAVIAVSLQLVDSGGAAHIRQLRTALQQPLDLLRLRRWEHLLRQLQLLIQIQLCEVLALQLSAQHIKLVAGIDRKKTQFFRQGHRAVLDAEKQVIQVVVQVVIYLQAPLRHGGIQRDDTAAAKHIHQCSIVDR